MYISSLHLSLLSLLNRRQIADLCILYSFLSGNQIVSLSPHLILLPPTTSRSHNLRILAPVLCHNQSYQNLISRTATIWNGIPPSVLNSPSYPSFRRALSKCIFDPFLRVWHVYSVYSCIGNDKQLCILTLRMCILYCLACIIFML